MAGLLRDRRGKAALVALILGLLTLSLAPTVAQRPASRSPAGHAGLRPDRVRLPPTIRLRRTPSPTAIQPAPVAPTAPPAAAPAPPEPPETIVIAAISPIVGAPPTAATAAAPPVQSPAPPVESPPPPPLAVAEDLDLAFAEAIVELTNEARLANGLDPLAEHPALVAAAEEYADLHAHLSPDRLDHRLNGSTLGSRAEVEGYASWTFLAENLAWSSFNPPLSPAEVVQEWLASPAHRDNMLNPIVNETGVGCYVSAAQQPFRICVQDFGARP